jgi:hypothetical protein
MKNKSSLADLLSYSPGEHEVIHIFCAQGTMIIEGLDSLCGLLDLLIC